MSAWVIVLIVVLVLVLLAVGGAIAQRRRLERTEGAFAEHLESVNDELAEAHAADRGWERAALERAARAAVAEHDPEFQAHRLVLTQVIDSPGTEGDRAVFRVCDPRERELIVTLARHGDGWYAEEIG